METLAQAPPKSFPSLEAEAAFWRERAAVAEAAARDAREELEEFQVRCSDSWLHWSYRFHLCFKRLHAVLLITAMVK